MEVKDPNTGVVDQNVDSLESLLDSIGKVSHGLQIRHVEYFHFNIVVFGLQLDFIGGWLRSLDVSASQDNMCAPSCKVKSRLVSDATVCSSDDRDLSIQPFR